MLILYVYQSYAMLCPWFAHFGSRLALVFLQTERVANNRIASLRLYALAAFAFALMGLVSSVVFFLERRKLLSDRKRTQWLRVCEFYIN